jgi:hypothetical protein
VPYQIYRQPIRSAAGSMQLPEGTIIDLNYSGDDLKNYFPRLGPNISTTYGVEPDPYQGTPAFPQDNTPVIIMFTPSGSIEQVYCRYWQLPAKAGAQGQWVWHGDRQLSAILFLIGQRERVPADVTNSWPSQLNNNWTQGGNIWVSIHPRTGVVTSAEIIPFNLAPTAVAANNTVWSYMRNYGSSTNARGFFAGRGAQMTGQ